MTVKWTEKARAKINLTLFVGNVRKDGYHDVATVLHMLSLCDTVRIKATKDHDGTRSNQRPDDHLKVTVTADVHVTDHQHDNLAYRAVRLIENELVVAGYNEVDIHIEKKIPMAAGLAGGSADAAAVLRGLARSLSLRISESELLRRAKALGSDVPACMIGGTVFGVGRGENVIRLDAARYWWVLASPGGELSAGEVYQAYSSEKDAGRGGDPDAGGCRNNLSGFLSPEYEKALKGGDPRRLAPFLANDLERSVCRLHPDVTPLLHVMRHHVECRHLLKVIVSGSGPTVMGLATDQAGAAAVAEFLRKQSIPWVWWGESEVQA